MVYPQSEVELQTSSHSPSLDLNKAYTWSALTQANFKLNGLKKIDESMVGGWLVGLWVCGCGFVGM